MFYLFVNSFLERTRMFSVMYNYFLKFQTNFNNHKLPSFLQKWLLQFSTRSIKIGKICTQIQEIQLREKFLTFWEANLWKSKLLLFIEKFSRLAICIRIDEERSIGKFEGRSEWFLDHGGPRDSLSTVTGDKSAGSRGSTPPRSTESDGRGGRQRVFYWQSSSCSIIRGIRNESPSHRRRSCKCGPIDIPTTGQTLRRGTWVFNSSFSGSHGVLLRSFHPYNRTILFLSSAITRFHHSSRWIILYRGWYTLHPASVRCGISRRGPNRFGRFFFSQFFWYRLKNSISRRKRFQIWKVKPRQRFVSLTKNAHFWIRIYAIKVDKNRKLIFGSIYINRVDRLNFIFCKNITSPWITSRVRRGVLPMSSFRVSRVNDTHRWLLLFLSCVKFARTI